MEFAGDQLPRMNWESPSLSEEWRKFKQHAELLFHGPLRSKTDDEKCCYLLIWVGEKGRDIYNSWSDMSPQERDRLDAHYTRFDEWVTSKVNPIFARSKFYDRRQTPGETLEQFVSELNILARDCDFADRDEMIRDRLVCGIYLQDVRQKLISEGSELSLKRALEIAKIYEMTQGRLNMLDVSSTGRASPFLDYTSLWGKRRLHERIGDEPPTPSESCDESGSSHETEEAQDFSESEQPEQDSYVKLTPMTFEDVSLHFSAKEWETLQPLQKELYKDVMQENYDTLVSLGYEIPKPELLCLMEEGKGPCTTPAEETSVFVPIEEDVTESFLLSLIRDDDDDYSDPDPDACDDLESTDDSVCSMPDVPELPNTNGPGKPQRFAEKATASVQEPSRNGKQWHTTVNCISTKPISNGPEWNFTAQQGNLGLGSAAQGRKPNKTLETQIRVNGQASPALHQQAPTPDMNQQNKVLIFREQQNSPGMEKMKADGVQQQLKPFNNGSERVGSFHLGADIPLLLNIKEEEELHNGYGVQPKTFIPLNLDIKEEDEAIPICDESSQASTEITPPRTSTQAKKGHPPKAADSERSSHSDAESSRRHSTRIKEKQHEVPDGDVAEQSTPLEDHAKPHAEEGAAQTGRKRKSQSRKVAQVRNDKARGKGAQLKSDGPRKTGPKPRNRVQRAALKSRLPEQQVPLTVQKMYRCSKCNRSFGHYSQFIAHQRYEMRKKPPQRAESVKRQKRPRRASSRNKSKNTPLGNESEEASTSQRVTRSSRRTEGSQDKENDSSKSSQADGQRLRARKSYACDTCKESFSSRVSLTTHKGANNEEVYRCNKCEASSAGQESNSVGTKYECGICQKAFVHKSGLVAHLRIHTGDKPHQCSECEQMFSYKSALIVHQRTHKKVKVPEKVEEPKKVVVPIKIIVKTPAATPGKIYKCPQCEEEFTNSTHLYTHQQTHTGPKPHPCHFCDKSFNDKTLLAVHQKTHSGESPYQCGKCHKTFTSQSLLLAHSLTHTAGKPFQCNQCDKSFNGEVLMLSHQKTHKGEKSYPCVTCKELFKSEALLAEHQKVHIDDKPHKCDYCEKGFNSQSLLIAHRRIHTGEKAFHCHYCGEGFNTSSLLNVHLRNHAPEKPYPCDVCERSFNLKSLLLAHRSTHDKEKEKEREEKERAEKEKAEKEKAEKVKD